MSWLQTLFTRWAAMAPRERRGLTLAAFVVGAALIWAVLLAPALRTLKSADAQAATLAAERDRMLALKARATALKAQPTVPPQEALKSLQAAGSVLGKGAVLQVTGEQATLTLKQIPAVDLAQWLNPTTGPSLSPVEAQLQRDGGTTQALWSGMLVYRLPAGSGTP
jgi:general secretion pathway protein M